MANIGECSEYLDEKLGMGTGDFAKEIKRPVSTVNSWFRKDRFHFDLLVDAVKLRKAAKKSRLKRG